MYEIVCPLPAEREPWNLPLARRRTMAADALRRGVRLVLLLYGQADSSTFRYRGYNLMQATLDSDRWQSVYFFLDELPAAAEFLPKASLLVLIRLKWSYDLQPLILTAKKRGVPVLFDVDDMICDIRWLPQVTNTLNVRFKTESDYDFWFSYISRLEYAARLADGFLTTNAFLAGRLQDAFGKPCAIIPNGLNREQLAVSAACRRAKALAVFHRPFLLGYFSGTPSHIIDFQVVCRELTQLLDDLPDVTLRVVGYMDFPPEMTPYIQSGRVVFSPLVDFLELQRLISRVDVNLVPLVNNAFSNCKSELKFFEAAAVDTVTVATPTFPYQGAIQDGETGCLCLPGQWYDTIRNLYEHRDDAARMARAAREHCLRAYAGRGYLQAVEAAYQTFAN